MGVTAMRLNRILCLVFCVLLLAGLVYAVELIPSGNVNGMGIRKIYNFTNISANYFCNNTLNMSTNESGTCYTLTQLFDSGTGNWTKDKSNYRNISDLDSNFTNVAYLNKNNYGNFTVMGNVSFPYGSGTGFFYDNTTMEVGIGTSSPEGELHIRGADVLVNLDSLTGNTYFRFTSPVAANYYAFRHVVASDYLGIYDYGTSSDTMVWQNGSVGIGTITPATTLDIVTGTKFNVSKLTGSLHIKASTSDNDYGSGIVLGTGRRTGVMDGAAIASTAEGTDNDDVGLAFFYHDATTSSARTEGMRLNSDGKVGIGTTVPSAELEIAGAVDQTLLLNRTSSTGLKLESASSGAYVQTVTNNKLILGVNSGTDDLVVDTTGYVGIGVTSPQRPLHILGDIRAESDATDYTTKYSRFVVGHYNNSEEPLIGFHAQTGETNNWINFGGGSTIYNTATYLAFFTASNTTTLTGTERMRINSAGNVGIGTTSPTHTLSVTSSGGSVNFTGGQGGEFTLDTWGTLAMKYGGLDFARLSYSGSQDGFLKLYDSGNVKVNITSSGDTFFNGGNVGINTDAPSTKLEVKSGAISTDILKVTSSDGVSIFEVSEDSGTSGFIGVKNSTATRKVLLHTAGDSYLIGGDVGIGTNAPTNLLETYGGNVLVGLPSYSQDFSHGIGVSVPSTGVRGFSLLNASGSNLFNMEALVYANGTLEYVSLGRYYTQSWLSFKPSGSTSAYVGIGTITPTQRLTVAGTTAIGSSTDGVMIQTTTGYGSIVGLDTDSSAYNDIEMRASSGTGSGIYVKTTGNVGIGTTAPAHKLEVAGSMNVSGDLNVSKLFITSLANCDTINTSSTGELICGNDASGAGGEDYVRSSWTNVTYDAELENGTIVRYYNTSWIGNTIRNNSIIYDTNTSWITVTSPSHAHLSSNITYALTTAKDYVDKNVTTLNSVDTLIRTSILNNITSLNTTINQYVYNGTLAFNSSLADYHKKNADSNLNMSERYNITNIECIKFQNAGLWCGV